MKLDIITKIDRYATDNKLDVTAHANLLVKIVTILMSKIDIKQEKRKLAKQYALDLKVWDDKLEDITKECKHEFLTTDKGDSASVYGFATCDICDRLFESNTVKNPIR